MLRYTYETYFVKKLKTSFHQVAIFVYYFLVYFIRVAELMNSKGHLTKEGLEAIRKIKQGMNTSRSAAVQHEQSSAQDMRK
jgi:hypothetical protein